MKRKSLLLLLCLLLTCMLAFTGCSKEKKVEKPSPDKVLQMLKDGNERFLSGKSEHPHLDQKRMTQAALEDQGNYAYATVLAASDSRVPVEAIFDAGIMDIFTVRVPGYVCNTDQAKAIEYGVKHVRTPVVLVLGNTQSAAVADVTRAVNAKGQATEKDKPMMFDNIEPAVKQAMKKYPQAKGDEITPLAIEENVYVSIRDLFMKSPAVRELVKAGKVKVVGGIYDVSEGRVYWLEDATVDGILKGVENPEDKQAPKAPEGSEEAASTEKEAAPDAHKADPKADEQATETHGEVAPQAHDDAAKAEAPSKADETMTEPKAHDTEVSGEAAPESPDVEEVAPETHEAEPKAVAPEKAEEASAKPEAPAEPETHDTETHDTESHN